MAVSAKNFKFISPGIKIEEIDRSQIPADEPAIGACVIGRSRRGPAFTPVEVRSFSDFVSTFGEPVAGGQGGDVWREGNYTSPMYATYAAQSWLRNGEALTFMRTLGVDQSTSTDAGLAGWRVGNANFRTAYTASTNAGGAYALMVMPSASNMDQSMTGSVAAIFYMNGNAAPCLSGSLLTTPAISEKTTSKWVKTNNAGEFVVSFSGSNINNDANFTISFDKGKSNFIRKVFNTNPTLLGLDSDYAVTNDSYYFLGETFENFFSDQLAVTGTAVTPTQLYGAIVGLGGFKNADGTAGSVSDNVVGHDVRIGALEDNSYSKSGWFLSQDLGEAATWTTATAALAAGRLKRLFRFVGLESGEWTQNNIKVSLTNILAPKNEDVDPYATFSVQIRQIGDNDAAPAVVESFEGCNLNPNSDDYLLRRIGTKYVEYDYTSQRIIEKGEFANVSRYVRVEAAPEFSEGFSSDYVPFGVTGPTKLVGTNFASSSNTVAGAGPLRGVGNLCFGNSNGGESVDGTNSTQGILINFPSVPSRTNTSGLNNYKQAYYGAYTTVDGGNNFRSDIKDLLKIKPSGVTNQYDSKTGVLEYSFVTSLEELTFIGQTSTAAVPATSASALEIRAASRAGGYSLTTTGSLPTGFNGGPAADLGSYKVVLNAGAGNLTTLFFGGTDGFDITESDPLSNQAIGSVTNPLNGYEFNTLQRAINTVKNPEIASYNVISLPGLENEPLQNLLIQNTEERADALAVFDIENSYLPPHEYKYSGADPTNGNVVSAVNEVKTRKFNSSYAATYYPWVKIRDSINSKDVWVPPSIAALGAMSYTDRVQAPWFAPAGFNRGGLSTGVSGLPVVATALKLFKEDRDDLYEVNVNPIATFPNEGVVIFGQKTLQVERSALDRINVRRLLVFLKRGISVISNRILFEPNVPDTWDNFKRQAIPFLTDVKTRYGLTDYKLILDETTTTPDLIDQNILYAKLFIKPARAIEYIALDFIITNTGASFDD